MSLLKKMVKKTAVKVKPKTKAGSTIPMIPNDNELINEAADKVRVAITTLKQAKADSEIFGNVLIDFFEEHQETEARAGNFRKSYRIAGNGDTEVKIVQANKVLKIASDDIEVIKKMLKGNFETLFEETESVSLKSEIFTDEKLGNELMALLGKNEKEQSKNFAKFFDSTEGLKIKTDFDKNRFKLKDNVFHKLRLLVKMIRPGIS